VENRFWPPLCSVLFPGWGQFLNGQPKKGLFFLLFGVAGFFAAIIFFVTRYLWPVLKASAAGLVFEIFLVAALMLMPLFLLMWIVAVYDSYRSCREKFYGKRRPPQPDYSLRRQKARQRLIPRGTAVLGLLLAISVGNQFFPKEYYLDCLQRIRITTVNNDMEIIPELAGKAIEFIDR
jgi:TM2 domain-containing membrane protein YozV